MVALLEILCLFIQLSDSSRYPEEKLWIVTSASRLEITGATNVNRFRCSSTDYAGVDTLTEMSGNNGLRVLSGVIYLNTSGFDCENALITRDFKKTLRQDTYPELSIELSILREHPGSQEELKGVMTITIAGISKNYPITCSIKPADAGGKHLEGQKEFKLSDFNLSPPQRLSGVIKVTNNVSVEFHLRLRAV